ncbi:MAG: hypothetical protein C5B59_05210 [Bacteroidetes bacterium]|nr:MAG: hypothetical protein C5B59_05210 [Bacteroidota bacterium]
MADTPDVAVDSSATFNLEQKNGNIYSYSDESRLQDTTDKEDSIYMRAVPESLADSFRKSPVFEYANDPAYWRSDVEKERRSNGDRWADILFKWVGTRAFRIIFLILIVSVLAFAIFKIIAENRLYLFYSPFKKIAKTNVEDDAELTVDELEKKIAESMATNDYRNALRFMYLKLLKMAGEKGMLHLRMSDTNKDYLGQIKGHPLSQQFDFLTNAYEHVWYGGFLLKADQFQILQNRFDAFYNNLKN